MGKNPPFLGSTQLVDPDKLEISPSEGYNVRLGPVRADLDGVNGALLLNFVEQKYLKWVSENEYLILGEFHPLDGFIGFAGVKASKRGNDVYHKRVTERFNPLMELPDTVFFNYKDRSKRHKTRAMFVTLTYDQKGLKIGESWEQIGEDFNRFSSSIRRRFGSVAIVRVWEAHNSGFPHIHAIMVFEEAEFGAFHYEGSWRIQQKRDLEAYWPHGFIDVEALSSTRGGLHYVAKYLGKLHRLGYTAKPGYIEEGESSGLGGLVSKASVRTLSLMWVFRKRAFSISGSFIDLIEALHNSNCGIQTEVCQLDLMGVEVPERVTEWILCGFFVGELIKGGKVRWSVELSHKEYFEIKRCGSYRDRLESPGGVGWCGLELDRVPSGVGWGR